jgi:uncharacterized protein YcbX
MMAKLAQIWRHPIKGIGAEALEQVALSAGLPLPLDRAFAALEEGADTSEGWRACRNFLRGAKEPSLMAIKARMNGDEIELSHPDRPMLKIPLAESSGQALFDWLAPIYPETQPKAVSLVKAPEIGLADAPFASVSVLSLSSLRALAQKAGVALDPRRFRGNLWLDGLAPWEEFDLIGKTLTIDDAQLEVLEPITRCRATEANPETGERDLNTLQVLKEGWGHTNFGVYAKVTRSGSIACGASVSIS